MNVCDNIVKISYSGEVLYNIVLENHTFIVVNNLIVETLSPNNIISKIYSLNLTKTEYESMLYEYNDSILKNDHKKYMKICRLLEK